jgi:predicted aspartyl protease
MVPTLILMLLCLNWNTAAQAQQPACQYVKVAEMPLQFRDSDFSPTVEGTVHGKPIRYLVDTGASQTALTAPVASRLGLYTWSSGMQVEGIGGTSDLGLVRVNGMSVGTLSMTKASFYMPVIGEMGGRSSWEAILGIDYLLQRDLEISYSEGVMRFFIQRNCDPKTSLGYWGGQVYSVPLEGRERESPEMIVEVNGVKMRAEIDTGASATSITRHAAERAGVIPGQAGTRDGGYSVGAGRHAVRNWIGKFAKIQIGPEVIHDAELSISETSLNFDILLGNDFLRSHRVLISASQRKIYISYEGGQPFYAGGQVSRAWVEKQAAAGNTDAMLDLADRADSQEDYERWLKQAAEGGNVNANLRLAKRARVQGKPAQARPHYERALAARPDDDQGLWERFLARAALQEVEAAKAELKEATRMSVRQWPYPIHTFLAGTLDEAGLLKAARTVPTHAKWRTCQAGYYALQLYGATGRAAESSKLLDQLKGDCPDLAETAATTKAPVAAP